ncbi:hypothetical protein [Tolumonas auensis]|uniref:hypothetical protein n=1 Tax=Tolumonas auensis TaxID=43948 RepID=UPI002AA6E54B|nr:hypothetical protein [Tolumonas auensis]
MLLLHQPTNALFTKLENINAAVEARIAELEGRGVDLKTVYIQVTVDATTGAVSTTVVDKVTTSVPTGATGSTGTGGGTGN